jgi:putative redox protein
MKAEIEWKGDVRFEARSESGHVITLDGAPEAGGQNAGPRPMELVLMGTGACSSFDVVLILKRSREDVTGCVAQLIAERAETEPKVFTHVRMHFVVTGRNLSPDKVKRAVDLSAEKYCSASIMLGRAGVAMEHSFEIREAE